VGDANYNTMAAQINKLHALSSRIKVGMYLIPWVLYSGSQAYLNHPDWVVRNQDGTPNSSSWGGYYDAEIGRPDFQAYLNDSIRSVLAGWNLDFLYIDGGDAAWGWPDWQNNMVAQYRDHYTFFKIFLDAIKARGADKSFFMNSSDDSLAEMSFQELGGGTWGDGVPYGQWTWWRCLSDALYYAKLGQRDGRWVSHLYPYDLNKYFSYMLALALKPDSAPRTDEDFTTFYNSWLPYVNVAYELKDALLMYLDAGVRPWWRSEETEVDAFALGQGGTAILTAINHAGTASVTQLSASVEGLGLDRSRPVFAWVMQMADPEIRTGSEPAVVVEDFMMLPAPGSQERLSFSVNLPPERVKLVSVSQAPGFVYSAGDYRTQLRLSDSMKVALAGGVYAGRKRILVQAQVDRAQARVMVPVPAGWGKVQVWVDGYWVTPEWVSEAGMRFAVVSLERGEHQLVVGKDLHLPTIRLATNKTLYHAGERLALWAQVSNPDSVALDGIVHLWLVLPSGQRYWGWELTRRVRVPAGGELVRKVLEIPELPPAPPGFYKFHGELRAAALLLDHQIIWWAYQ